MQKDFKITRNKCLNTIVVLFIVVSGLSACKKFVEIDAPQTQVVTATIFESNTTAHAALTVIYSKMINESGLSYRIPLLTGLSSDELDNHATLQALIPFYTNSLNSQNGLLQPSLWTPFYNYIYQANAVIEGLNASNKVDPAVKNQLLGEAKFIRAFCTFYLTNVFGDIPLVTTTDYKVNSALKRSSKEGVYNQIISDLKQAQLLLKDNFVDATDTTITSERVRPTKWAASAFLARVYLYNGDYNNAEIQASSVIANSSLFSIVPDLNNVFLKNSQEAIWQLQPVRDNSNTPEGASFILKTNPQTNINNCSTISDQLLNTFEIGDNRKINWIGYYNSYPFPYKYKQGAGASATLEYCTVLRLAELFLIRAEARAQGAGPGISGSVEDLNVIRNRAGLANYSGLLDKTSLLTAVYHERQVELFAEWGHRWFDLRRTNTIDTVMTNADLLKGGVWNSNSALFPVPQSERDNDPNLTQNPGY